MRECYTDALVAATVSLYYDAVMPWWAKKKSRLCLAISSWFWASEVLVTITYLVGSAEMLYIEVLTTVSLVLVSAAVLDVGSEDL